MSEQKALFDATRELSRKISNLSKNSAVAPEFFEEFQKELGGARGLGQLIAEDFKRMHGIGLSATEQKLFSPDEKTIQRYWQTLMVFMQQQDRHNAVDISSLSDKELQATLLQLAQELILENPGFRSQVIRIAVAQDRDLINELAMKAGLLGDVVEGDTEPEEPEAIVREDNPAEEPDDFDVDVIEPEEH
ncbi:MAG: hypothetical protein CMK32_08070 [Porticoccaceae bacterium]|nr:hypothetical protein [Porticoccaceae bacterium]